MEISKCALVLGMVAGLMFAAVVTTATPYAFGLSAVSVVLVIGLVGLVVGPVRR
ncbi:hypothetical protein [Arthrobacter sp. 9MFCol3.1]|uniref:hypothetical protein n=1 Tax=Arthrobacter sp. 9MFCol3.1 TaxID=1150398 RepID=UPI0012DE0818|nr:hypothetical protein [Arthrobacter sp. 9MFCol3.1]